MNRFVRKGFGVLGAALLVLGSLPASALAQAEVPDLVLTPIGQSAKDRRMYSFEVKNEGLQWSKATQAHALFHDLVTGVVRRGPTFQIPDLNPKGRVIEGTANSHTFTVTIPDCPVPMKLQVFVDGGRAHDDAPEANLGNNTVMVDADCHPKPPPAGPAHLQVGMHVETFSPKVFASHHSVRRGGDCKDVIAVRPFPAAGTTGWLQQEAGCGLGQKDAFQTEIAQTGVAFDLSKLDEIKNLRIKSAKLKFDEAKVSWLNGDETPRPVTTCVANVALATQSIATVPATALVPNAPRRTPRAATKMTTVWDLELDVRHAALNERGSPTRYQYVIKGDEPSLTGQDDAACMSKLSNVRLEVEYETLP